MPSQDHGRFCWYDLMSTDPAGSQEFYGALFGWRIEPTDLSSGTGEMTYNMLFMGDMPVGGIVPLDEKEGLPTHWIPYIAVDDINAFCEEVGTKGGKVCVPPMDIGLGTFAVVNDPQGAFFSPWQGKEPLPAAPPKGTAGVFCWNECMTTDAAGGADFYPGLLNWRVESLEMEVGGMTVAYRTFIRDDGHHAGILEFPPAVQASGAKPHWLSYVTVDDVDASTARAAELGATVLVPCTDLPMTGRFSVIRDPQGGMLSLFTYSKEGLGG